MGVIRYAAITSIFVATACFVFAIGLAVTPHVFLGSVPSQAQVLAGSNAPTEHSNLNPPQAYWKDPDFDPEQRAFYYVRVLEIPTPSWLSYDHAAFGVEVPEGKAKFQQERAYTSPIWYTPEG